MIVLDRTRLTGQSVSFFRKNFAKRNRSRFSFFIVQKYETDTHESCVSVFYYNVMIYL